MILLVQTISFTHIESILQQINVGAAFIESGNKWEEILLGILKEQGHVVHTGSNSDNQR